MAVHTYEMNEGRTCELFFHVFYNRSLLVTILNGTLFQQLQLYNIETKGKIPYEMSVATPFEASLYFHVMVVMSKDVGKKKLVIYQDAVSSTLDDMVVQFVQNYWDVFMRSCFSGSLYVFILTYM